MKTLILFVTLIPFSVLACPFMDGMTTEYNRTVYQRGCTEYGAGFGECVQEMKDFGVDLNGLSAGKWIYSCYNMAKKNLLSQFASCTSLLVISTLPPNSVNAITWMGNCEFSAINSNEVRYSVCMNHFTNSEIDHNGVNAFRWINGCRVASHYKNEEDFMKCMDRALVSIPEREGSLFLTQIERCMENVTQ